MAETTQPIDLRQLIPEDLRKLMLRLAQLERGRAYSVTILVPESNADEPVWSVLPLGKIENLR